jgi:DNA-3-methyladenine glycosylase
MEPIEGKDIFSENRFGVGEKNNEQIKNLLNGPAKICKAFEITKEQNGKSLLGNEIYILDAPTISEHDIVETTRIGIRKSAELPWRFYLKDNEFVSKK